MTHIPHRFSEGLLLLLRYRNTPTSSISGTWTALERLIRSEWVQSVVKGTMVRYYDR